MRNQKNINRSVLAPRLKDAAYHGIVGKIVRLIEPHTEADPAAIMLQLLTAIGNCVGASPHFRIEAGRHGTNLNICIVGETAKARKGTAWGYAQSLIARVDPEYAKDNIKSGLSTGEGLIWAVRDPVPGTNPPDPGVSDKRLLVVETEFSSPLKTMHRDTNILSSVLRNGWDGQNLSVLVKNCPYQATNPHISVIGHVTKEEVMQNLNSTDVANGFGNRFLWVYAKRSKLCPLGGSVPEPDLESLIEQLRLAVRPGSSMSELTFDEAGRDLWIAVYPKLSEGGFGLFGALTARSEAQVLRLACIYAILDRSAQIKTEHLQAALAVWQYCEESCRYIFGNVLGNPVADRILQALHFQLEGLSRTEITELFKKHKSADEIYAALQLLKNLGVAYSVEEPTEGRPIERWFVRYGGECERSEKTNSEIAFPDHCTGHEAQEGAACRI